MSDKPYWNQPMSRRSLFTRGGLTTASVLIGAGIGVGYKNNEKGINTAFESFKTVFQYPNAAVKWDSDKKREYARQAFYDFVTVGVKGVFARREYTDLMETYKLPVQAHELSCEFSALEKTLAFKGILNLKDGIRITEELLINATPISEYNNPLRGRPKDLDSKPGQIPPEPYGIYSKALAAGIVTTLGSNFEGKLTAWDYDDFYQAQNPSKAYLEQFLQLSNSGPFVFWFAQNPYANYEVFYDQNSGKQTVVAPSEHAAVCTAATPDWIQYIDPKNNQFYRMETSRGEGLIKRSEATAYNMLAVSN